MATTNLLYWAKRKLIGLEVFIDLLKYFISSAYCSPAQQSITFIAGFEPGTDRISVFESVH